MTADTQPGLRRFAAKAVDVMQLRGLLVVAVLLVAWEIRARMSPSPFFPTLGTVLGATWELLKSGDLWLNVQATLVNVMIGFVAGSSVGFVVGTLLAVSTVAARGFQASMTLLRHVPMFGLVPILILWFGTQDLTKIVLISISAFFPVLLQTQEGIRTVPKSYLDVAAALTFSRRQALLRVLLPNAMPSILTGIRHAVAYSWISGVGVELFIDTGEGGLGNLLSAARIQMRMDFVLIGMGIVAVIGYAMTQGIAALERRVVTWVA